MPFLICCDNKGCFETTEALLEPKSNLVYCGSCGKEIKSVTHFAKVQMKSLGQVMKNKKTNRAYSIDCSKCNVNGQPFVGKDGSIFCRNCQSNITSSISGPMAQAIRLGLGSGKQ